MSRVMASVCGEKSHDGVRMPTGRWPETFSSMSAERICRSRSVLLGQDRVALVDPAVDADLVAIGGDAALLVGMEHGRDGRHVEGRGDRVFLQQRQDARDAGAVAVLALAQAADRLAAFAQLAGLVVGVERDRHGAARAVRPHVGPQRPAGAHALDDAAPALLGPLPGLLLLLRLGNDGRACRGHGLSPSSSSPAHVPLPARGRG